MRSYQNLVNRVEDYIEENLDGPICLEDIARHAHVSMYHLHRLFRRYSFETIKQYSTRIKMERSAIFLVVNARMSITEVAYRYGFSDSTSYSRTFRKYFAMSPTAFRRARNAKP